MDFKKNMMMKRRKNRKRKKEKEVIGEIIFKNKNLFIFSQIFLKDVMNYFQLQHNHLLLDEENVRIT